MFDTFLDSITAVLNRIALSGDKRHYLLNNLVQYTKAKRPAFEIFEILHKHDDDQTIRDIAQLSKAAIREGEPFARDWAKKGYFTNTEQALLVVSEKHNCIDGVCQLFLDPATRRQNFLVTLLFVNAQWIGMVFIGIWMSILALSYESRFTGDDAKFFFTLAHFYDRWWFAGLVSIGSICVAYLICVTRLTGEPRVFLKRFGCFRFYQAQLHLKTLQIINVLAASNIPPQEILDALIDSFPSDLDYQIKIRAARTRLAEMRLLKVLPLLFPSNIVMQIRSSAPDEAYVQISDGCKLAAELLTLNTEREKQATINVTIMIFLILALGTLGPLVTVLSGVGLA